MASLYYASRLTALDLESLEVRRIRADLIYTYKLLFGLTDSDYAVFFNFSDNTVNILVVMLIRWLWITVDKTFVNTFLAIEL